MGTRLDTCVEDRNLGVAYSAPTAVVLSETDVVQPDLLFISLERVDIVTPANIVGAPELLVEIRSNSTAERGETLKRKLYPERGVKEYWLVDPDARTITVLLLGEDGYAEGATYTEGKTLTSSMLAGLSVNLNDIFLPCD